MKKLILLMKNGEVIMTTSLDKYFNDIRFILFQADSQLDTFILQEPKKYMLDMDKAIIAYESVITQHNTYELEYSKFSSPMTSTVKEVHSITEMIQYLQSLHRIKWYNEIVRSNRCPIYEEIQFKYFRIEIFCKGKRIYKKNVSHEKERKYFYSDFILDDISDIYSPLDKFPDRFLSIDYHDMQWGFYPELHYYDDMCGILLTITKSITFFKFIDLIPLKYGFKNTFIQVILYNPDILSEPAVEEMLIEACEDEGIEFIHEQSYPARYIDIWPLKIPDSLEIIIYLPYLFMTWKTISEVNDNGCLVNQYIVKARITVETKNEQAIEFTSSDNDPFLPMDLIKVFREEDDKHEEE